MFRRIICFSALCFLFSGCMVNHLVEVSPTQYAVQETQDLEIDQEVLSMIMPYKQELDDEMKMLIGNAAIDLPGGRPESKLGNFVADALHSKVKTYYNGSLDFTVANRGGLRIPEIEAGPISQSLIFELLPFDNIMVVLEIDGKRLETLVQHMASQGGWPQSKGLYYKVDMNGAIDILVNGTPVDPAKRYAVAMPDYIANGGGNSSFLRNIPQISTKKYMRDLVIEYIKEQKSPITASIEGRVEIIN